MSPDAGTSNGSDIAPVRSTVSCVGNIHPTMVSKRIMAVNNTYRALGHPSFASPQAAKVAEFSIAATSIAVGRNSTQVSFEEWTDFSDDDSATVIVAVASIDTLGGGTGGLD